MTNDYPADRGTGTGNGNAQKFSRALEIIRAAEPEVTARGWYGEVVITIKVQDGVVQHVDGRVTKAVR